MKKIVSSVLWVFLVLGAAALLSGCSSQADADPQTSPWTGQWTCAFEDFNNPYFDHLRAEGIMLLDARGDGTIVITEWITYQFESNEVMELDNTYQGVVVEESFPTITTEFAVTVGDVRNLFYGRCIGNLYDEGTQTFTGATCNTWGKVGEGESSFVEQSTCVRTFRQY